MVHIRKILTLCAVMLCLLLVTVACQKDDQPLDPDPQITVDGMTFTAISDSAWQLTKVNGTATELTVPAQIEGRAVTTIGTGAFTSGNVTAVHLPDSIQTIEPLAFADCAALQTLTVGEKDLGIFFVNGQVSTANTNISIGKNAFLGTGFLQVNINDSHDGDTKVAVSVSGKANSAVRLSFRAAINENTDIASVDIMPLGEDAPASAEIDFGTYGVFKDIKVSLQNDAGEDLSAASAGEVAVTAPHYNFAYLNGSYPVLVYSLKLKEITGDGTLPTFVFLERCASYDWDALTYGMRPLPFQDFASSAEKADFHASRTATAEYIGELYRANPESSFTLYIADNYNELILQFLVSNRIPEDRWNAVLLSDGSGTAFNINEQFAVEDPSNVYAQMKTDWEALKKAVYEQGFSPELLQQTTEFAAPPHASMLPTFSYVITKEQSNVAWWCNRLRAGENLAALNEKDPVFTADVIAQPLQLYTNGLLAALTEDEQENFKQLYRFSDDAFAVAEENGKKIMIILGTSYELEADELYDYVKMTMMYYGDDYVYYYKGHPGFPNTDPVRTAALERLAAEGTVLYTLDNAIAAEIILFYNPDVSLSGWISSTFDSVEAQEMACMVFNFDIAAKSTQTYGDLVDIYALRVESGSAEYEGIALNSEHRYFVMCFNNTADYENQVAAYEQHEIALFDATEGVITYYKLTADGYKAVA